MNIMFKTDVRIHSARADVKQLPNLIEACLPKQGCVEVQHDQEGKEHAWHTHDTDETIVMLDGALRFYWEGGEAICKSGDVIELPKGTRHGSVALAGGAKYIITFETVELAA